MECNPVSSSTTSSSLLWDWDATASAEPPPPPGKRGGRDSSSASASAKRGRSAAAAGDAAAVAAEAPRCQVEGCGLELGGYKEYYRKHRVCEPHTKCLRVVVAGQDRRFCQQCSRSATQPSSPSPLALLSSNTALKILRSIVGENLEKLTSLRRLEKLRPSGSSLNKP